jgi:hypothetical protein
MRLETKVAPIQLPVCSNELNPQGTTRINCLSYILLHDSASSRSTDLYGPWPP